MAKIVLKSQPIKNAKKEEFKSGVRPDGNIIGTYRNSDYALFKSRKNPSAGGRVDLMLTGAFVQGLFIENKKPMVFSFDSKDTKASGLFEKYGEDLRGMNLETFHQVFKINHENEFISSLKSISGIK